jgi:5-methylthioribose kinase
MIEVIDLFNRKFLKFFDEKVTDYMAKTEGFKEYYLDTVLIDTAAYAGTELIRRTVGMAQVKDITTIPDEKKRIRAERVNVLCAKDMIMNRRSFKKGTDFTEALARAVKAVD